MNLGENIFRLRTQKNMSQGDLANALNVSRQSVSKWENNSAVPELDKLVKMADIFGVTLDALVSNTPTQPKPEPAPAPAPAPGITTGDLVSILLLLLGIVLPLVSFLAGTMVLVFIGWLAVPPLVTLGAAHCSPRSRLLLNVFCVYNFAIFLVGMIVSFLLGALSVVFNIWALVYWLGKQDT
jgi:transcriptional regulator with XRE-family HTH domain